MVQEAGDSSKSTAVKEEVISVGELQMTPLNFNFKVSLMIEYQMFRYITRKINIRVYFHISQCLGYWW